MAIIPELTEDQWSELTERLTLYASCKVIKRYWRGLRVKKGQSFMGFDAADIAANAIVRVIVGKRKWNVEAYPNFSRFLESVVDSIISALVRSPENRRVRRLEPVEDDESCGSGFEPASGMATPDEICELAEWGEKFKTALDKELGDDSVSKGLFECLHAGITDRSEIAEYLELTVTEIYNAQKRLNGRIASVLKKLDQGKKS